MNDQGCPRGQDHGVRLGVGIVGGEDDGSRQRRQRQTAGNDQEQRT